MTNKLIIPFAAAAALGAFLLQAEADDHEHDTPAPLPAAAFAGKIAVVYVQNALPEDGIMIRDAKLEQVGGRWFLTGQTPDIGDPEDWMADTPVAVDWQRVESYNLLTEEQFEERVVEPGGAI